MDDHYSKEYEFYEHEAIGAKYPIPKSWLVSRMLKNSDWEIP